MKHHFLILGCILTLADSFALADSTEAACEIYPSGEDHTDVLIPCHFSQRQGYITIYRSDGVSHDLSPAGDTPGNFKDQNGAIVYRQSGLGDQGVIFRFPTESIYLYWNADILTSGDESTVTAPFSTSDYDATALLRCKTGSDADFESCPAGILRMQDGQASVVVKSPAGEQFTINFMSTYVNATNREVTARLDGDTWILNFENGEVWEVPLAAIEGG